MKRRLFTVLCLVSGLQLAFSAAAYAQDPSVGTWRADIAKSTYYPADLAPKSLTATATPAGNGIHVVVDVVDSKGNPLHYEYAVPYDGKDVPVTGDPARDTTSMKRIDDRTFEQTNKKDGKVTTISRFVYAKDGKSRTQATAGTNAQGQRVNNQILWLKQ